MNTAVGLRAYVQESPDEKRDFQILKADNYDDIKEVKLEENELLCQLVYVSVDPYQRGRMSASKDSYIPPFEIGRPIDGYAIAKVLKSKSEAYAAADLLEGFFPWQKRFIFNSGGPSASTSLRKLPAALSVPPSYYVGVLGMPGMTAWLGLHKICKPKKGETLFVSAAAGAVGQVVGQLGKRLGLRVIGSAGTDEKVRLLTEKFHFDDSFNYKTCGDYAAALRKHCPQGIDCYFDNVGGDMLDAVLEVCNHHCRIACCGAISLYNMGNREKIRGLKNTTSIVFKQLLLQGFILSNLIKKYGSSEAISDLIRAVNEKEIHVVEDVIEAPLEDCPKILLRMLRGDNVGKQVVKIIE